MTAADGRRTGSRRPSAWMLTAAQVRYQLRVLVRSPIAAFATLVIPLMVLLAVNLLYQGTRLSSRGGIRYAQFFTAAMVAFAVVNACYMSVISSTTLARDDGILKRIRSTPLPPWVYMAGRVVSAAFVALVSAIVVIAVGAAVYDFEVIWSAIPGVLLVLAVGMFCFCALGLAVTVVVPSADSALPIAWGTILPLCFISDVFQPIDTAPRWLQQIASVFPLRPFADDLESAFNPVTGGGALHWEHLAVVAAWGIAATAFALLAFRWEPGGREHGDGGSGGAGGRAAGRLRELLEPRHLPEPAARRDDRSLLSHREDRSRLAGRRRPRKVSRSAVEGQTEWIEAPAPAEDSSVPPEPAPTPPVGAGPPPP